MVSCTQQFDRIRKRKKTTQGKRNKRTLRATGTPAFAVHPEGYDAKAADAKPAAKVAAAPVAKAAKAPKGVPAKPAAK